MIATITLNPSIDQHIGVKKLVKDDTVRAQDIRRDPGGKGINVSRVVKELGGETRAYGIVGGCTGYVLREYLRRDGIPAELIDIQEETRINMIIRDSSDNTQTRISAPGPNVSADNLSALIDKIKSCEPKPSFWVMGGGLPPGVPPDIYAKLINLLAQDGVKCVLDTDDEPFKLGLEAKPFMIKPNEHEAERLLKRKLITDADFIKAAEELHAKGIEVVIISRGAKGAIFKTKDDIFKVISPPVEAISKVGAGDSTVASMVFALERGETIRNAALYAVAAGTAAVLSEGTKLCIKADVESMVHKIGLVPLNLKKDSGQNVMP